VSPDGRRRLVGAHVREVVSTAMEHLCPRAGDARAQKPRHCGRADGIVVSVDHQGGGADVSQARGQIGAIALEPVEMPDRTLVLAATPYTPAATRRLLAWARERFGERRMVAINNGYHVDNLGGNAALRAAGIPIYGCDLTVTLLAERGEKTRQQILGMIGDRSSQVYAAHATLPYVPPDHVFPAKDGLVLRFGGEEVRVIYPGPSQAPDKLAMYFPARALLFGGCMLISGDRLGNVADADLEAWPRAIATLARLPVKVAIPAHGDRLDPGLLQNTLDVLARARPATTR
jgi:metallo-beta-lactamase class B